MKDQYVILRFLAFFLLKAEGLPFHYKSNIDDLLAETMKCINQMQKEEIKRLQVIFKKSMHASFQIMGPDAFRFIKKNINRRPINMALFEAVAYFFTQVDVECASADLIKEKLDNLKIEFDNSGYFSSRVDSTPSVDYRFEAVKGIAMELTC